MSTVFKFSVVRFRPFAETGEFANVGVILIRVKDGLMEYKLAPRKFPRIKHFFDDIAYQAYDEAIKSLGEELARATEFLPHFPSIDGDVIFTNLISVKESSLIFSSPRIAETQESYAETLERIYARFVRREPAIQTNEEILTKGIRRSLQKAGINWFRSYRLNDDLVPVIFPLAFEGEKLVAIKPLAFSQKAPMAILDHGAHWRRRFDILLEKGKLAAGNVLIAAEPPGPDVDDAMLEAYLRTSYELRQLPFKFVELANRQVTDSQVIEFARRSSEDFRFH